ncbi:MAG: hypothetical protein J6M65_05105, partial [Eubacterium sp.]|nr:hypothetical protein [Eubacterium sp.]
MGKKGVEEMIDEIEVFIENCKYQPLSSNKIIVPKDELDRMLNELKLKLPSEIERCKKIMRNKEAILASARTRSDAIISESVNEANRLVDSHHITELANARANEIIESARDEASQIVGDANAEATEVRMGAMLYTKEKIKDIRDFLRSTIEAENENYKNLMDSLENGAYTMDTNLNEVEASLALINSDPSSVVNSKVDNYDIDDDYDEDVPAAAPAASDDYD